LNLIAGLDVPDAGDILIDNVSMPALYDDAATRLRRKKFSFIVQAFHVLPCCRGKRLSQDLSLHQNVALPLLLNGVARQRAQQMLAVAAVGLQGRGDDFPCQLSGGKLQRVAIAHALVHEPKLALAGAPIGNLDPDTAHEVIMLLRNEIKANGASGINATYPHAATADRVLQPTKEGLHDAAPTPSPGGIG
jgi:putative ABC transport system ATP-binding protein